MKFTTSGEIKHIVHMLEQGLEEHSKWMQLWNSKAICHLNFPKNYLDKEAHQECEFAKWFQSCKGKEWLHQVDYDSITTSHKAMHFEGQHLAEMIQNNKPVSEEDYYKFVNSEWSFANQLQKLKDKITRLQISFDPLTGVFNRQAMMPVLLQEQAYVQRDNKQCGLAMADLDKFKRINDTYGHANGDIVLKCVADFLRTNLRPYDALFRYGGEEFLFCLPSADIETGISLLDRIRMELEQLPIKLSSNEIITTTISMGITQLQSNSSVEDCIIKADEALYEAKNRGRNQVVAWENLQTLH